MDFIFALNHSIIPRWTWNRLRRRRTHVNSVSFMVPATWGRNSVGPLRMPWPSEACERAETTGLWPTVTTGARPAREWISGDNLVEGNRKSTPLQSRRLCTLECRVEFPLLSIYMALSLYQQPPVSKPFAIAYVRYYDIPWYAHTHPLTSHNTCAMSRILGLLR